MKTKKASADWAPLSQIFYELNRPQHPLYCALTLSCEETIANAVRSGEVPVRGHRDYPGAFDRIEKHMTLDAEISVYWNKIAVKLAPPAGAQGATVVHGMRHESGSLPSIVLARGSKRVEYVNVEADRPAVEAWISENALPAGWISAAEGSEKVRSPAGRKPSADWDALEAALELRIRDEGFPTLDNDDENWRCKADVIRWAQDFLEDRKESVERSTVAGRIYEMLRRPGLGEKESEI